MARPLIMGAGRPRWNKFSDFTVFANATIQTGIAAEQYEGSFADGTFRLLVAIANASGRKVRDITAGVNIYNIASANTPYVGTPENPLASYQYTGGSLLGADVATTLWAGIMGEIPSGLKVVTACFYSNQQVAYSVGYNLGVLKYYKIAVGLAGTGAQYVTVYKLYSNGTTALSIQKMFLPTGAGVQMTHIQLGNDGYPIGSGEQLIISTQATANTYVAGVFLFQKDD